LRRHRRNITSKGALVSPFTTYIVGFIVLIAGLCFAAYLLNVPPLWIAAGAIVMLGVAIILATTRTRTKEPTPPSPPPSGRGPSGY
jgi:protein-S-isoprenylcysteine O-methyltransferase Ste14